MILSGSLVITALPTSNPLLPATATMNGTITAEPFAVPAAMAHRR